MSAFTQRCFWQRLAFTHKLGAFTLKCLYAQVLLHRHEELLHRCAGISTNRCLYTAMLLHRNAFTHQYICFYTGILLTQSSLYTQKLLHKYSYAEMVPTVVCFFTHRYFFEEVFLHRFFFTERCFYTRVLLD